MSREVTIQLPPHILMAVRASKFWPIRYVFAHEHGGWCVENGRPYLMIFKRDRTLERYLSRCEPMQTEIIELSPFNANADE